MFFMSTTRSKIWTLLLLRFKSTFSDWLYKNRPFEKQKQNVASSTGKKVTNVNSTRLHLSCERDESTVVQLKKCAKFGVGLYFSLKCKETGSKNHKIFCKSILELESIERNKTFPNFNCSFDSPLLVKNQKKLTKLVGNRPLIKHQLNNKNVESLWDTGTMISLVNKDWLHKEFCSIGIQQ